MKSKFNIPIFKNLALCFLGYFLCGTLYALQSTKDVESLEQAYINQNIPKKDELNTLKLLASELKDPQKILKYSNELIAKATQADSLSYLFDGYLQKGNAYRLTSDLSDALVAYYEADKIANETEDKTALALINISIGDVFSVMDNHENSIFYYEKGIKELRSVNSDSLYLATALLNAGDEYFNVGDYGKAMVLFTESSIICRQIDYKLGAAYNLGNMGMVYAKQGKQELAEANINDAIKLLEVEKDYKPIALYLIYISKIYLENDKPALAIDYAERSMELAKKYQFKDEISEAYLQLSKIYEQIDEPNQSLYHFKQYVQYKDSISNLESIQDLGNLRTEYEVSKKQIEVDFLNQQKRNQKIIMYSFIGGMFLVSLLAFGLYRRNRYIIKTKNIINQEKEKIDRLLYNILPKETAEELKKYGKVKSKKYDSVTVLFTDFKGFSKYSEKLEPEKVVATVDMYFSEFDRIIEKYNIEKIKTIGDSYMCASGLPKVSDSHPHEMAKAAIEMMGYVHKLQQDSSEDEIRFEMRLGMHTGPVVAGVVGKNKFSYDIWGDTVNIASRMESTCEPGKINVSESTYHYIKDRYSFESRGEVSVKNRGTVNMYYLSELA